MARRSRSWYHRAIALAMFRVPEVSFLRPRHRAVRRIVRDDAQVPGAAEGLRTDCGDEDFMTPKQQSRVLTVFCKMFHENLQPLDALKEIENILKPQPTHPVCFWIGHNWDEYAGDVSHCKRCHWDDHYSSDQMEYPQTLWDRIRKPWWAFKRWWAYFRLKFIRNKTPDDDVPF